MPTREEELATYAAAGAKRLDTTHRGKKWAKKVNQDRLDILATDDDILGQIYGSFEEGLKRNKLDVHSAPEFGFALPDEHYNEPEAKAELEAAWIKELNERL